MAAPKVEKWESGKVGMLERVFPGSGKRGGGGEVVASQWPGVGTVWGSFGKGEDEVRVGVQVGIATSVDASLHLSIRQTTILCTKDTILYHDNDNKNE